MTAADLRQQIDVLRTSIISDRETTMERFAAHRDRADTLSGRCDDQAATLATLTAAAADQQHTIQQLLSITFHLAQRVQILEERLGLLPTTTYDRPT